VGGSVLAVLGGLGAAVCFTVSALCASSSSHEIGAESTLAWVMLIGLVLVVPPAAALADPAQLSPAVLGLLAAAGVTNVAGLLVEYVAFRRGKVGVVTGIASTEGMVAALISAVAGARLGIRNGLLLALVTLGVAVSAASPDDDAPSPPPVPADGGPADGVPPDGVPPDGVPPDGGAADGGPADGRRAVRGAVLAVPVALLFGVTLYTTGRAGQQVSVLWALVPARLFGSALVTAPLAARRRLRLTRRALPLVAAAGAAEVLGVLSYTLGARHGLAVAAVLSSQFAALTAVAAYVIHGQRLSRSQLAGLAAVVAGVSLLSALGP
jgi:drug/metabolite transporter (DMT)-like permease